MGLLEAQWARIPEIQVRIQSRAMGTFFPHTVSSIFCLSLTQTRTHTRQKKRPFTSPTLKKNDPLPLQLSRLLPVATNDDDDDDDDDDDRTRRSPLAHFTCAVIHKLPHCPSHRASWNCVQPFIDRQLLSSPPVVDVDRDRLWGDGLAASSPVGVCRKFRREESQKARLERKRAVVEHRDVQHRVSGFVGFRYLQPRRSLFIPCSCRSQL